MDKNESPCNVFIKIVQNLNKGVRRRRDEDEPRRDTSEMTNKIQTQQDYSEKSTEKLHPLS